MMPRTLFLASLSLALLLLASSSPTPADEPKKAADAPKAAEPGMLLVIDAAGKEHKLKKWTFTGGVRPLTWLAPPAPPEKEPEDKKPTPRAKPTGPEAFVLRESDSTRWQNGVLTLVPVERIRSIDFDAEKEIVTVRVATSDKADADVTLTGTTQFQGVNKLAIDAEVDKGDLGVAEVRFLGGVSKGGIRGVRFPSPKPAAENKEARKAGISYGDKAGRYVANVTDLQALYRRDAVTEVLSPLLFFKKTLKIDLAKIKKIMPQKEESTQSAPVWQVTLKTGDESTLTLLLLVQLDGKDARLEGLIGKVPAGYRIIPVNNADLLHEIEFDVTKEAPKPDADK